MLHRFGTDVTPGVQFAVNDPYAGGTHLNDLTLLRPIHIDGELVAWVANRAHHADVGGEAPGSMPADAVRLDQEGHVVSPTLAVRDGEWVEEFTAPFLTATRTPAERAGDLSAQLGANEATARRVTSLIGTEGINHWWTVTSALLDYGERRMRAALSALPDGEYPFVDHVEWGQEDIAITASITIDGVQ